MKLILWILNITNRHSKDIYRYQRGGIGVRVATIVISFLFAGLTVASEMFFLDKFYSISSDNFGTTLLILFALGILTLALLGATLDYCACFCYVGFKMSAVGIVLSAASIAEKMRRRRRGEDAEIDENEIIFNEERYKIFDMIVGIFELALVVGLLVLFAYLLFYFPPNK